MEEIISLNGSSFKIQYNSPQDRIKAIMSLQTNLAQNPGFETVSPTAQFQPANWASIINSGTAVFPYNSTSDIPGRSGKGAAIVASTTANAYWAQMVSGISSGTSYTLTAYAQLTSVSGTGAYIEIDWFSSTGFISTSVSTPVTGTLGWTLLTASGTAPAGAISANIALILNGSGTVVYDDVSLTAGGGGGCGACSPSCPTGTCVIGYCSGGTCVTGGCGACSPSCPTGTCVTGYCSGGTCVTGGGGSTCTNCDLTTNYCVAGACLPKTYIIYGAVGFGALFILSMLRK